MEKYFVICNSNGDTTIHVLDKETLLKGIEENYWGSMEFLNKIPDSDTNYWGDSVVIIKGEIVTPTPLITVTKFDIK